MRSTQYLRYGRLLLKEVSVHGRAASLLFQRLSSPVVTSLLGSERALNILPSGLHDEAVWIPHAAIEHHIAAATYRALPRRFVQDGSWDFDHSKMIAVATPVQQLTVEELIVQRVPFRDTARYQRLRSRIENGQQPRGLRTTEELEERYFRTLIAVHEKIRDTGIKTRRELQREGVTDASNILVLIDRDGRPILLGGKHRFAICGVLDIPEIPVQVRAVHKVWAQGCMTRFGGSAWTAVLKGIAGLGSPERSERRARGAARGNEGSEYR